MADPTYQNPTFGKIKTKTAEVVTEADFLATIEESGVISKIDPEKLPMSEAVRTGKVFQDYASYSTYSGLGLNKANSGIILIGDSNAEGYNTVGVGSQNWYNILVADLQKNQGQNSGIGFTNLSDLTRYGVSKIGTTSIVSKGATNTAIQMTPNSELQFTSATNLVEVWMETGAGAGKLEFYYNNTLYRTIDLSISGTVANNHSFLNPFYPTTPTPDGASGSYRIKCTTANVVVTALFTDVKFSEGYDTYWFLRDAVAGMTFGDFDINDIKETTGIGGDINSLYLLALGTNSIYSPAKATTSTQFATDLTNYINGIKSTGKNIVFLMPPQTLETTYPAVLEPYANYLAKAVTVCNNLGIEMIDLNGIFLYNSASSMFGSDGLHYSVLGNDAVAKYVMHSLANIDIDAKNTFQSLSGNVSLNIVPKKAGTDMFINSRISDDGTHIFLNNSTPHPAGNEIQADGGMSLKVGTGSDAAGSKGYWVTPDGGASYAGFTWQLNADSTASLIVGYSGGFNEVFRVAATGGGIKLNSLIGSGDAKVLTDSNGVLKRGTTEPARYKVLISQTGTSAPTVTIIENTLGEVSYSYSTTGAYTANSANLFTAGKTFLMLNPPYGTGNVTAIKWNSDSILDLKSLNGLTPTDGIITSQSLLIEVYP